MRRLTMRVRALFVLLLLALAPYSAADGEAPFVSMPALLANPATYAGKMITVCGYFARDRESVALFLHREDHDEGLLPNSISVTGNESEKALSKSYVLFRGTFSPPVADRPHITGGNLDVVYARPLPKPVS
jgi:hypothetical protein